MNELIKEVVKSKGRRCTCIAYEVECDNCPFGEVDCTDKDLIYNIAKSLIKEDKQMVKILVALGAIQLVALAFMKATGDSNKEFDDDVARMARIEKWRQDNEKRR